jgi:hypothetical protein
MNLDALIAGIYLRSVIECQLAAVKQNPLDDDRRRLRIERKGSRVDYDYAVDGRELEPPVTRADACRVLAAVAFRVAHPISLAIRDGIDC